MRGEWIEIDWRNLSIFGTMVSLPMRGEWIEMVFYACGMNVRGGSLPMRGEWIEIACAEGGTALGPVSPHAGRVD